MANVLTKEQLEEAIQSRSYLSDRKCPACHEEKVRVIKIGIRDNPDLPVYICGHCRLQFIEPRWKTEAELNLYYRTEYREQHDAHLGTRLSSEERHKIQYLFAQESLKTFREEIPEGGSVLEIGCSAGGFLRGLAGDPSASPPVPPRHELYGAEWNPEDAAYVRDTLGIPCEEGLLDAIYPGKTFTAVVAIHVFEHQPDPFAFLLSVKKKLIGGGYLYMEIPHANDPLSAVYLIKEYQDFFYRDVHLTYWLPHQLHWYLDSVGFEAKIQPFQRYGLLNHLNWLLNKKPMEDGLEARKFLRPVPLVHPAAPAINRVLAQLDSHYRIALKGLWASDSLSITARRQEI